MPVSSMTGFARTEGEQGGYSWVSEMKSVNSKGLDVRCRLPYGFDSLEPPIRDLVSKRFQRGSINVTVTLTRRQSLERFQINQAVLDQILAVIPDLQSRLPGVQPPSIDGLLAVKGVVETVQAEETEEERKGIERSLLAGTEACLAALVVMRADEGRRLTVVLTDHVARIEGLCDEAAELASTQPAALKRRLNEQLGEIMGTVPGLSEERLAQEVALLVAKADVREELDRLASHIEAARRLLSDGGAVGRKFDFLCQEFNREANTLCSKSADVELTRRGLDLKAAIEQMREQVQNIE